MSSTLIDWEDWQELVKTTPGVAWEAYQLQAKEIERLRLYPAALQQIREERKPGCIIPTSWYLLLGILDRIDELVESKAAEAEEKGE